MGGTKANLKPANSKARALLRKLHALAEQGIDGEKISAQKKIARLKARFNFTAAEPAETLVVGKNLSQSENNGFPRPFPECSTA
jgi:hypothetical protein